MKRFLLGLLVILLVIGNMVSVSALGTMEEATVREMAQKLNMSESSMVALFQSIDNKTVDAYSKSETDLKFQLADSQTNNKITNISNDYDNRLDNLTTVMLTPDQIKTMARNESTIYLSNYTSWFESNIDMGKIILGIDRINVLLNESGNLNDIQKELNSAKQQLIDYNDDQMSTFKSDMRDMRTDIDKIKNQSTGQVIYNPPKEDYGIYIFGVIAIVCIVAYFGNKKGWFKGKAGNGSMIPPYVGAMFGKYMQPQPVMQPVYQQPQYQPPPVMQPATYPQYPQPDQITNLHMEPQERDSMQIQRHRRTKAEMEAARATNADKI